MACVLDQGRQPFGPHGMSVVAVYQLTTAVLDYNFFCKYRGIWKEKEIRETLVY